MEFTPYARNAQGVNVAPVERRVARVDRGAYLVWALCGVALTTSSPAFAGDLSIGQAWVAPNDQTGVDVGLFMTIKNDGDEADALLRASCPVANFSERRTVDVGEGGLSDRAIPNIPVPAHSSLELTAKTYHVSLLQTRDKLAEGQSFTCNLSFRKAGGMEVKVMVSQSAPKS